KLNSSGSALVFSTYLGGTNNDNGQGVALPGDGSVLVAGYTASSNFPTANAYQGSNGGSTDAFVTRFNSSGSALSYSTYLGGSGNDYGYGIAVDSSGKPYVAGSTTSSNFPVSASPVQASLAGASDAFVTSLTSAGTSLNFSTYLGGSGNDY